MQLQPAASGISSAGHRLSTPAFPAHVRRNPLFNDEPQQNSEQERICDHWGLQMVPDAMDIDDLMDTERQSEMSQTNVELSQGPPDSRQVNGHQSMARFSGSGIAQPGPKRMALGMGLSTGSSAQMPSCVARRHSEPLAIHITSTSNQTSSRRHLFGSPKEAGSLMMPMKEHTSSSGSAVLVTNGAHASMVAQPVFESEAHMQAGLQTLLEQTDPAPVYAQRGPHAVFQAPQPDQDADPGHLTRAPRARTVLRQTAPIQPNEHIIPEHVPIQQGLEADPGQNEADPGPNALMQNARQAPWSGPLERHCVQQCRLPAPSAPGNHQALQLHGLGGQRIQAQCSASADLAAA